MKRDWKSLTDYERKLALDMAKSWSNFCRGGKADRCKGATSRTDYCSYCLISIVALQSVEIDAGKLERIRQAIVRVEETEHARGFNRGIREVLEILGIDI